jgi:hypothetical protein
MAYIGAPLVSTNFVLDQFTATAGQTAFTLTQAPASAQSVLVGIDGVVQEPGVAYTVSGTALTMTSGVPLDSKVWVVHLGVRGTTTSPADGSVTEDSLEATFATQVRPQSGTAQNLSGTAIDFTNIPSWVKRITISIKDLSTNGVSSVIVQLGDAGGLETTGYSGVGGAYSSAGQAVNNFTTGFALMDAMSGTIVYHGSAVLTLLDASINSWAFNSQLGRSDAAAFGHGAGSKALSATLDRIRITTVNGTDAFDSGSVNILYE